MAKLRFRPISYFTVPDSAKRVAVLEKAAIEEYRIRGWSWFVTIKQPDRMYAISRDLQWFIATADRPFSNEEACAGKILFTA